MLGNCGTLISLRFEGKVTLIANPRFGHVYAYLGLPIRQNWYADSVLEFPPVTMHNRRMVVPRMISFAKRNDIHLPMVLMMGLLVKLIAIL
jgi:hypothetical protein